MSFVVSVRQISQSLPKKSRNLEFPPITTLEIIKFSDVCWDHIFLVFRAKLFRTALLKWIHLTLTEKFAASMTSVIFRWSFISDNNSLISMSGHRRGTELTCPLCYKCPELVLYCHTFWHILSCTFGQPKLPYLDLHLFYIWHLAKGRKWNYDFG